VKEKWNKNCI